MKFPTIPYDKSLHVNYGAAVAAFMLAVLYAAAYAVRLPAPRWAAIPIIALIVVLVVGKVKEILDERSNEAEVLAGRPPLHSVETWDIRFTVFGGALVCVPAFILAVLLK